MSERVRDYLDLLERRSMRTSGWPRGRLDSHLASLAAAMTPQEIQSSWSDRRDARVGGVHRCSGGQLRCGGARVA